MADSEEGMELICVSPEDQNDPNTKCMIHLGVMENPYIALCVKECNKSCCEVCIKKHKEQCNRCPNCNTPESLLNIHFNGSLKAKIDAQLVYCFHQPDGCKWEGERGDHQQHLMSCDWHERDCKYGCGHRYLGAAKTWRNTMQRSTKITLADKRNTSRGWKLRVDLKHCLSTSQRKWKLYGGKK